MCNCWATRDHYKEVVGCCLCGKQNVWEGVLHLVTCRVGIAVWRAFGITALVGAASDLYISLPGGNNDWGGQAGVRRAVALDVVYNAFNAVRHHPGAAGDRYNWAIAVANARRRTLAAMDGRLHAVKAPSYVIK